MTMKPDPDEIIRRMVDRMVSPPVQEYLLSDNFSDLCRRFDAGDDWMEALVRSRDKSDLFGKDTIKTALASLFSFVIHGRRETFPGLFMATLGACAALVTSPLPLDELKQDLADLGWPEKELEEKFAAVRRVQEENLSHWISCPR